VTVYEIQTILTTKCAVMTKQMNVISVGTNKKELGCQMSSCWNAQFIYSFILDLSDPSNERKHCRHATSILLKAQKHNVDLLIDLSTIQVPKLRTKKELPKPLELW